MNSQLPEGFSGWTKARKRDWLLDLDHDRRCQCGQYGMYSMVKDDWGLHAEELCQPAREVIWEEIG